MKKWMCDICGYAYDGAGFEQEPEDYVCPVCDHGKSYFALRNIEEEVKFAANELIKQEK